MKRKVVLVDDDTSLLRVMEYHLAEAGYEVRPADNGAHGLKLIEEDAPDLVITDVKLGDMSGLDLLAAVKESNPELPVIVITAFGSIKIAVAAMQQGAFNFLSKPFERDTLRQVCRKAVEFKELESRNRYLQEEVERLTATPLGMTSNNRLMGEILGMVLKAAGSNASILITGESGTGKEVLARMVHRNSPRADQPMIVVNCAALPSSLIESELFGHVKGAFTGAEADRLGRFQAASGGTLFLDEIAELPFEIQAKLLRAVQEHEVQPVGSDKVEKVDVRLVTATNRDLKDEIEKQLFREDLFYRLSVIPVALPALKDRPEDIEMLANFFLGKLQAPLGTHFTKRALAAMSNYHWPGNIRELRNVIERALILCGSQVIDASDLQLPAREKSANDVVLPPGGIDLYEVERTLIVKALERANGNRSEAARLLRIPRHVLIYRLGKFAIDTALI